MKSRAAISQRWTPSSGVTTSSVLKRPIAVNQSEVSGRPSFPEKGRASARSRPPSIRRRLAALDFHRRKRMRRACRSAGEKRARRASSGRLLLSRERARACAPGQFHYARRPTRLPRRSNSRSISGACTGAAATSSSAGVRLKIPLSRRECSRGNYRYANTLCAYFRCRG